MGIDCVGLVMKVAEEMGHDISMDRTDYIRRSTGVDFLEEFKQYMVPKNKLEMMPGDVLLFRDNAYPYHVAIVGDSVSGPTLIHSHADRRKVIEEYYTEEWKRKAVYCFEFPEE
jgi:cell wall-associated NlpC family hydrolase